MADEPLMFTIWVRNDVTGEAAQFKGQGKSVPEAFKEGWDNANEDFGKTASGGPPTSRARLAVKLPGGETAFRTPGKFASREPYDPDKERDDAPTCSGEAARPYSGPLRARNGGPKP